MVDFVKFESVMCVYVDIDKFIAIWEKESLSLVDSINSIIFL